MAINATTIETYTDAEMLKVYRWAMANGAAGQTRSINGRAVSFPPMTDLMKAIEWLESRINAASDGMGGNIALGSFSDPE